MQVKGVKFYDAILKSATVMDSSTIDRDVLLDDTRLNGQCYYERYTKIRGMDKVIFLKFMRY